MNVLRGFRALNLLGKQHTSKIYDVRGCSMSVPWRKKHDPNTLFQTGQIFKWAKCATLTKTRVFSSDADDSTVDKKRQKLTNDPEVKAWMNQMDQDFDTPHSPFQETKNPNDLSLDRPSVEVADSLQPTAQVEVEDFGYFEEQEDDFADLVPQKEPLVKLQRGLHGVFDVEDIVDVLQSENGVDVQVINISPEARFVDHMVVVTGKSLRHMRAIAARIEKLYKSHKRKDDPDFHLEGRDCKDWLAIDLGNMVVHIFTKAAREHYALETLWTLGPEFDEPRHYIQDECLELPGADQIWKEEMDHMMNTPPSHTDTDTFTVDLNGRCSSGIKSDVDSDFDSMHGNIFDRARLHFIQYEGLELPGADENWKDELEFMRPNPPSHTDSDTDSESDVLAIDLGAGHSGQSDFEGQSSGVKAGSGVVDVSEVVGALEEEGGLLIKLFLYDPHAVTRLHDHAVVAIGMTPHHVKAMAAPIKRLYTSKKRESDPDCELQWSEGCLNIDLGNIVVHLLTPEVAHEDHNAAWKWTDNAVLVEPLCPIFIPHDCLELPGADQTWKDYWTSHHMMYVPPLHRF